MWWRETLQRAVRDGESPEFFMFWGFRPWYPGSVDRSCLSQFFPAPFGIEGIRYSTTEQYMMAEKAKLFGDSEIEQQILQVCDDAHKVKKLGRQVRNFDLKTWERHRCEIVIRGNVEKFDQNPHFGRFLLDTGDKILVEASPDDQIWGIGLGENETDARNPLRWPGLNLLGFCLMAVRDQCSRQTSEIPSKSGIASKQNIGERE